MPKDRLLIWGASGHALVVADIIRLGQRYEIIGFLDDVNQTEEPKQLFDLPIFTRQEMIRKLASEGLTDVVLAVGNCAARLRLAEIVRSHGLRLATAIHPSAIVAFDAEVGAGTVIAAGSVINPAVHIGENVIVNTRASVDHDCQISTGAHICPGVTLGGGVIVGKGAWIGIGSTVKDHVVIGSGTLIGAGSVVVSDVPDNVMAYGVPAKIIRGL